MARAVLLFSSNAHANRLVAGIPAAVRAAMAVRQSEKWAEGDEVVIAIPGGWGATAWARAEFARLLPATQWSSVDTNSAAIPVDAPLLEGGCLPSQARRGCLQASLKSGIGL